MRVACGCLPPPKQVACRWLGGGFGVALGSHWGGFVVALECLSVGYQVALGWLWIPDRLPTGCRANGFVVAQGWLCSPESMPSICLVYGLAVASGGLSVQGSGFRVQGSMLDVRCWMLFCLLFKMALGGLARTIGVERVVMTALACPRRRPTGVMEAPQGLHRVSTQRP
jgi:hypothetical protein